MSQTKLGALKVAASRIGVTFAEYSERLSRGEKWCTTCRAWLLRDAFDVDRSRHDGLCAACRKCRARRPRQFSLALGRVTRRWIVPARDGDKLQARARVNYLINHGRLPEPNAVPCVDCGHVWAAGERRHEYDHHRGYDAANQLEVEAVCTTCHHARERRRSAA